MLFSEIDGGISVSLIVMVCSVCPPRIALTGFEILKVLKDNGLTSKVVMVSAVGQQTVVDKGIKLGAEEYIVKPFTSESLVEIVNKVMG